MGLFSSEEKTKQTQSQDTTQNGSSSASNTPVFDPKVLASRDFILQFLQDRMQNLPNFTNQYAATGLQNINKGADARQRMIDNLLRSKGLANTTAGANLSAATGAQNISDRTNFINTLPMFGEQVTNDRLNQFSGFVNAQPVGSQVNQTSNTTGHTTGSMEQTTKKPGGIFGDILGAAAGLAGAAVGGGGWGNLFRMGGTK